MRQSREWVTPPLGCGPVILEPIEMTISLLRMVIVALFVVSANLTMFGCRSCADEGIHGEKIDDSTLKTNATLCAEAPVRSDNSGLKVDSSVLNDQRVKQDLAKSVNDKSIDDWSWKEWIFYCKDNIEHIFFIVLLLLVFLVLLFLLFHFMKNRRIRTLRAKAGPFAFSVELMQDGRGCIGVTKHDGGMSSGVKSGKEGLDIQSRSEIGFKFEKAALKMLGSELGVVFANNVLTRNRGITMYFDGIAKKGDRTCLVEVKATNSPEAVYRSMTQIRLFLSTLGRAELEKHDVYLCLLDKGKRFLLQRVLNDFERGLGCRLFVKWYDASIIEASDEGL